MAPQLLHGTLVTPEGEEISVAIWLQLVDGKVLTIGPCFCRPPLFSGERWHEPGWHHMISCPMRPAGEFKP